MPSLAPTITHVSGDTEKAPVDQPHMDSPLSPTDPLFLPLNQLNPYCLKLLASLQDITVNKKEIIALEQSLWKEVKKLKALRDKANIITYLIGFYHTILFQIVKNNESDDIFQYHIIIRLGDLNRYLDRLDTAEYYYCNARNLFPNYGHAYNQLGLLTKSGNFYKSCYYYARAAKSIKRPLEKNLAESNLRIILKEHENSILNDISNNNPSIPHKQCSPEREQSRTELPNTSFDWFYVLVVAIYFDNVHPVAKPFMRFMCDNLSIPSRTISRDCIEVKIVNCDRNNYLLLATLDIMLDWLKSIKRGSEVCSEIRNELRQIKTYLVSIMSSLKCGYSRNESTKDPPPTARVGAIPPLEKRTMDCTAASHDTSRTSPSSLNISDNPSNLSIKPSQSTTDNKEIALPHDCVLKGFKPLEQVHEGLQFPKELPVFSVSSGKLDEFGRHLPWEQSFIGPEQLIQISTRIRSKIDFFGVSNRGRTRNIALESILSSMNSSNLDDR